MKKQILILCALFIAFAFTAKAQGIGVISRTAVYQKIPGFLKDLQMIDSLQQKYNNEVQYQTAILQEKMKTLLTKYNPKDEETIVDIKRRMTAADTTMLASYFKQGADLEKRQDSYNTKLAQLQKEKIEPVLKKVDLAIKKVSEADKLDAMFFMEDISSALAYINDNKNYTGKVIDAMKTP